MRGDNDMERKGGLYIYKLEYKFEDNKIICVPIRYHDGEAFVLSTDENGCWTPIDVQIDDFATIDEGTLHKKLCEIGPLQPYDKSDFYCDLIPMKLDCGQYYNSIYRPMFTDNLRDGLFVPYKESVPSLDFYRDLPITNIQEYSNLLRQLEIVLDDLDEVFKVIAPQIENPEKVYGHGIRNIIILACTEVDSIMQSILVKNRVEPYGKFFNMNDYYKLLKGLKLDEYTLSFYRYGEVGEITPFSKWKTEGNLPWYVAYNNVKHNREEFFSDANITNAIYSIIAFAIIMMAKYGYRNDLWNEKVGRVIRIDKEPQWDLSDFYLQSSDNDSLVTYPFPKKRQQVNPVKQLAKNICQLSDDVDNRKDEMLQKIDELKELLEK